ncbi:MAG: aminotransferase class I/II-fold pyridoxal phosphate-dependent enzyme [Deltaproteobacteria bacterium]|nr:aminotransferase class I/II-fold pyridoxal phosphate-dependent enzyme [Deltaproteobacteria bacterium]MBW1737905.1 aminotransferase class I/II-fold pyridoxal phosphate-dependent enzyme [Deltaproteobacteria bacterium]MBW1910278.1 aminotransferase class I/II-fold pyridoxal phosphate-dependent enzyme [Deltaproteobacteria bacterium]MBW2033559.1 aminotransferase class I/II-fold pyridoxal phosphate-dependent enzyme [Deltaproteobacteria bacterium]MBW2114647.1 aminotransferase class I/II-fold pyridox
MQTAKKLENFNAYTGPAMNQKIKLMMAEGRDIINLGLGDPDVTLPGHQLKALVEAVSDPANHHYPSAYPIKPFYQAIADWYKHRHGVDLDPETEVLYCLGAAEGIFQLNNCLLDPGDICLVPDPAYPSYEAGVRIAGGKAELYPLQEKKDFLPDLASIPADLAKQAKMIWLNFPNNPTTAIAGEEFFLTLIDWAKEYDIAVISDNPYMDVCFDGYRPPSFLKFPGAKEVGVELNSMSKSFNCCGWRVGMLSGNRDIISGMAKIKSQSDRGLYYPLQVAAIAALTGPVDWMEERNKMYAERRDVVVSAWHKMGLEMLAPKATFYCWGKIPDKYTSKEFSFAFLEEGDVWMIPGSAYGERGEGYVRISCAQPVERIAEAMERMQKFIS